MSDSKGKLQQLLDGELDPSEIANDPTLSSLAERIYGMDIKALMAEKGIITPISKDGDPATSTGISSNPMVEVIPEVSSLMAIPPPPAPIPGTVATGRKPLFIILGLLALGVSIFNLIVGIGEIYNPCTSDWCSQNMKLNWLSPHQISSDTGWGHVGTPGVPDYAMIAGGTILTILGLRKKA